MTNLSWRNLSRDKGTATTVLSRLRLPLVSVEPTWLTTLERLDQVQSHRPKLTMVAASSARFTEECGEHITDSKASHYSLTHIWIVRARAAEEKAATLDFKLRYSTAS